jgi:hypothetical protein
VLVTLLQEHLSVLYEAPVAHCVADFLVTDARLALALEAPVSPRGNAERLLLRQSDDNLDVTLYIDDRILANLSDSDPYRRLDADNLNEFLIALEGVSHFHYLIWNATNAKQITRLELELQAEVDKYVTASMLLDAQGSDAPPGALHGSLFDSVSFDPTLDAASGERYRTANHYAAKYCRDLNRRYPGQHREPSYLNELRRFYRLPQNDKIRRIAHCAS